MPRRSSRSTGNDIKPTCSWSKSGASRRRSDTASIRVKDDGSAPISDKGREPPFKQGDFYVFEVVDDVARYWNKMAPARREDLARQSRKEGKDIRLLVEAFVYKPAKTK